MPDFRILLYQLLVFFCCPAFCQSDTLQVTPIPSPVEGKDFDVYPLYVQGDSLYVLVAHRSPSRDLIKNIGVPQCQIYRTVWNNAPAWKWEMVSNDFLWNQSLFWHSGTGDKFWISKKEGKAWRLFSGNFRNQTNVLHLPGWENEDIYFPCLSPDGRRLAFCSKSKTGNDLDIYLSERNSGGWSLPKPDKSLNTRGNEYFPYFKDDYFLFVTSTGLRADSLPFIGFSDLQAGNKWSDLHQVLLPDTVPCIGTIVKPDNARQFVFAAQKMEGFRLFLATAPAPPRNRRLLLTIQLDQFEHWDSIRYSPYVDTLRDLLKHAYGYEVFRYLRNPGITELKTAFEELRSKDRGDDEIIILFRGHGALSADGGFHLIPADAGQDPNRCLNWLPAEEVLKHWDVEPEKLLFIFDVCHCGYFQWQPVKTYMGGRKKISRSVLCASNEGKVPDDNRFLEALTHVLKEHARQSASQKLSAEDLCKEVKSLLIILESEKQKTDSNFRTLYNDEDGVFYFKPD